MFDNISSLVFLLGVSFVFAQVDTELLQNLTSFDDQTWRNGFVPYTFDRENNAYSRGRRNRKKDIFQEIEDNNERGQNAAHHMTGNDKLVEADIVETPSVDAQIYSNKLQLSDATSFDDQTWRNGFVPYTFDRGVSRELRKAVFDAANDFRRYTCINWRYVSPSRIKKYKNYAQFIAGYGCYSLIGRQWSGKQDISLGYGCENKGVAIHEMMHALGMWHEQSRTDRDSHIKILRQNIKKGMEFNFNKYEHGKSLGEPYDELSIMHYGAYAFSKNGRKTIVNRHKHKGQIGQRVGFSFIDIRQLNKLYKCSKRKILKNRRRRRKPRRRRRKKVCRDENKNCPAWKREGYCDVPKFVPFMKKSCRKSCGYCR